MANENELRQLRKQANLTQKEAAEKLDIPVRTYRAYEREERKAPYDKMDHIREVLGDEANKKELPSTISSDQHVHEVPVPHPVEGRDTLVVDRHEAERRYGEALDRVRAHRVRSSSMAGVVDRGALIEYISGVDYQGPGMYLISLTGERPWPAYVRELATTRLEIETTNRKEPIQLVREGRDAEWKREDRGEVDFVIHGICERWGQSKVDL